jgi:hypothetical protein
LNDADIDRAILLLDAAAEQAQLAAMQANDRYCRDLIETQSGTIMQLLGLARSVMSRLG